MSGKFDDFNAAVQKADAARSSNALDYCEHCDYVNATPDPNSRMVVKFCIRHAAMGNLIRQGGEAYDRLKEVYDRVYDERVKLQSLVLRFIEDCYSIKNSPSVDAALRQRVVRFESECSQLMPLPDSSEVVKLFKNIYAQADTEPTA